MTQALEHFLKNAFDAIIQRINDMATLLYYNIAKQNSFAIRPKMLVYYDKFKVTKSIYLI